MKTAAWHGAVFIGAGFAVYDGPVATTSEHRHHALQVVLTAGTGVLLAAGGRQALASHALIPADAPHAIAAPAPHALIVYFEPESPWGRALTSAAGDGLGHVDPARWVDAAARLGGVPRASVADWTEVRELIDAIGRCAALPVIPTVELPALVQRLVEMLPGELDQPIRLRAAATRLGISPGRLSHLVAEGLGIPFRRYVRWLRLRAGATALAQGCNVTQAAHAAGFADAAHMNRTFRRMLGVTPTDLSRSVRWHIR